MAQGNGQIHVFKQVNSIVIVDADQNVAQVATHTLVGTGGTCNIDINGTNYLATFNATLAQTAIDFVATHGATLLVLGIIATAVGDTIVLTALIPGVPFTTLAGVNVAPDLVTTLAATTANVTASPPEFIPVQKIEHIGGVFNVLTGDTGELQDTYPFDEMKVVNIHIDNDHKVNFDIEQVTNQPTWTPDQAGLSQALIDLNAMI